MEARNKKERGKTMNKEKECAFCDEPILESEKHFKVSITDSDGMVIDYGSEVCECCTDEILNIMGSPTLNMMGKV
jgi:hypothetical protein